MPSLVPFKSKHNNGIIIISGITIFSDEGDNIPRVSLTKGSVLLHSLNSIILFFFT